NRLQPAPPSGAAVQAETAMLDGHFAHAPFVARTSGAPRGKVIYALRGGWLYVLATPGRSQLDVALKTAGTARVVASMAPSSLARSVFVRTAGRVESVDLLEHGRAVATASIVYAPQR
ncbi:MAG TPA: hypothetical protein VJP76_07645, partial [Candidatus Tumulicola sp.]|nr:hypothetical protein [Candidatus Tumulicola sp.]